MSRVLLDGLQKKRETARSLPLFQHYALCLSPSAIKSARFRPVRDRGDMSPPAVTNVEAPYSRVKPTPKEGLSHITSPRTQRQTRELLKSEGDKDRDQKSPSTAPEVIYF